MSPRRKKEPISIHGHRVKLPEGMRTPYEVYLNGVLQQLGRDFRVADGHLVFNVELVKEKLKTGAWIIGSIGIGTYERNDIVDVRYEHEGAPMVAHALPIIPD